MRKTTTVRDGPFARGRSSYRGNGQRKHHDKRYAKHVCHSKVRGNSIKSTFRYRKSGVERPPAKVKTSTRRRGITPFRNSEMITEDTVILDAVRGYKIEFVQEPMRMQNQNKPCFMKRGNVSVRETEIGEILHKNAIKLVVSPSANSISICKQSNFAQYFYSTKKGRRSEANIQFERSEQVHFVQTFQGRGKGQRRIPQ